MNNVTLDERIERTLRETHDILAKQGDLLSLEKLQSCYDLFRRRFGPERLRALEGEPLLEVMHTHGNQESLVYWLEFKDDNEFPSRFGSISGGSAHKFGLFRRINSGQWVTGASQNETNVTVQQAVEVTTKHRNELLAGVAVLEKFPKDGSDDDYFELQKKMDEVAPTVSRIAWGHKYFSLLFPSLLDDYHNHDYQRFHLIKLLQLPPSQAGLYVCAGRFVRLAKYLGWPMNHFTTALNRRNGRPIKYWRIGTRLGQSDSIWPAMHDGGFAAIGWSELGDLSTLAAEGDPKEAIRQKLERLCYPNDPKTASRKAGEIRNFVTKVQVRDVVLAADGQRVLGIGLVTGDYRFDGDTLKGAPHHRPVDWVSVEQWSLPQDEGKLTTVFEVGKREENLVEIERRILEQIARSEPLVVSNASFASVLRRYHDEQIIFTSSEQNRRYVVDSIDSTGVNVTRLDANEPQRLTFDQAEKLIQTVQAAGSLEFKHLNKMDAICNVIVQAERLALSPDRKRVEFLGDNGARLQNLLHVVGNLRRANPLYKPAMLLCVLDGLDEGSLKENRITFDWVAPRFTAKLKSLGVERITESEAAQPFYHLAGDLIWLHAVPNRNDLMRDGGDGPAAARKKINYALLKDTYWNLLKDPASRTAVRRKLETMMIPQIAPNQILSAAESAVKTTGFLYAPSLLRRFLTALAIKPFVILTGNSGTGKTLLAKLVAEWLSHENTDVPADPFVPGAKIESDRMRYYVRGADAIAVELWNREKEEEATKVTLPRQMIQEWADTIVSNHFDANTPVRTIREAVVPGSKFSSQLHSFESPLKAAALALLNARTQPQQALNGSCSSYVVVPVGADWTDNRSVVGFVNHLRKDGAQNPIYQTTPVLDLLLRAAADTSRPYFLILDEMNLSHVERYFSDFLSAMESKKPIPLHHEKQALQTASGAFVPQTICFPENLFVIGTVNVDETTYMFSPKVLDRANVLEFRIEPEQAGNFLTSASRRISAITPNVGAAVAFMELSRRARRLIEPDLPALDPTALTEVRQSLLDLFALLHHARLEFAFRTLDEVMRYLRLEFVLSATPADWRWQDCLDAQILQKILPKLHGSRRRLEAMLVALATYCENRDAVAAQKPLQRDADLTAYPSATPPSGVRLPLSYTKLVEMIEAVRRDQFVSYIQ